MLYITIDSMTGSFRVLPYFCYDWYVYRWWLFLLTNVVYFSMVRLRNPQLFR